MYGSTGSMSVLKWTRPVGQKKLFQRKVSSFTIFSQNQRPQRWKALPKKTIRSPTAQSPWTWWKKHEKHLYIYVLYVVFLGHFWSRLPRGFSVQYDTFIYIYCKGRSQNQIHATSVGLMISSPLYKNVQMVRVNLRGKTQKKRWNKKEGRSFWMPANVHIFWGNMFGGEVHKTLEQMMKTCTRPGETNMTYPTGGKRTSSWEVPTGRGYC